MGYRGKTAEQERARDLRARGWTYAEICAELGVARSSVSQWVRDVAVDPEPLEGRRRARYLPGTSRQRSARVASISRSSPRSSAVARMIAPFLGWFRTFFDVDEERLRLRLYLRDGLDLEAANEFWSGVTGIPVSQFRLPYRAVPDPSIRRAKHVMGCPAVLYSKARYLRTILGLCEALLSSPPTIPG